MLRLRFSTQLIIVIALGICAVILYYPILSWSFWKDDWWFLYGSYSLDKKFLTNILQPGTVLQFLIEWPIFLTSPLPYMSIGIGLKTLYAYVLGIFVSKLISKNVQIMVSLLALLLPIGLDAVGWPSAHVTLVSGILLMVGTTVICSSIKHKLLGFFCFGIACFLDPGRSILVILFNLVFLYKKNKISKTSMITIASSVGMVITLILIYMHQYLSQFQIIKFINSIFAGSSHFNLMHIVSFARNYFSSLSNLFLGFLISKPHYLSSAIVSNKDFTEGITVCFLIAILCVIAYRKKQDTVPIYALCWISISYITPWLFEPRISQSIYHRYMVIPGIGLYILLAWILNSIRSRYIRNLCLIALLCIGGFHSIRFLQSQSELRQHARTIELYSHLISEEKKYRSPIIFYLIGSDILIPGAISFAENMPISVLTHRIDNSTLPQIAIVPEHIKKYVCNTNGSTIYTVLSIDVNTGIDIRTRSVELLSSSLCDK